MTVGAVLLAGGESRRMGQDKATTVFRGEPLWRKQIKLLRCIQPRQIFVSARVDPAWRPVDVEFVPDNEPSRGPLSGIAATLRHTTADHLLVLAIDMPFMTAEYLRRIFKQARPGQGAVPILDNRAEPLAAIYPRQAKDDFDRALAGDDFSLQSLVRDLIAAGKLRPIEVLPQEQPLFRNLNEPHNLTDLTADL